MLQEKHIEKLTEASEQWEKDRIILQKDIWRNLLSGNMTQNQFCESAKRMDLYQDGLIYFKLICFYMDHKAEETQKWDPSTIEFVMTKCVDGSYFIPFMPEWTPYFVKTNVDTGWFCQRIKCRKKEKNKGKRSAQSFCAMDDRSCTFLFLVWSGKLEWIF